MAYNPLTIDQLRNVQYPENSLERVQQKAHEESAVNTFVEAMKKFDYADSNVQKRQLELEVAKVKDRTGVQMRHESSFWNKGAFVFPKGMIESSVRETLVKVTKEGDTLPIDGNQEEGYSVAVSDFASAAPDLVNAAKAEQQKELLDLKAAQTEAANKTLAAYGWDLSGYNHRWHKHKPLADNPQQTVATLPKASVISTAPAEPAHTATTYAIGGRSSVTLIAEPMGIENTLAAHAPEKTPHVRHYAPSKVQHADTLAEIRHLVEKTRLAALESASASKNVILSLAELKANTAIEKYDQQNFRADNA